MENKTKLFIVFILIISIGSVIISHRTYLSFIQAKKFTLHFNTRAFEDVDQNLLTTSSSIYLICQLLVFL